MSVFYQSYGTAKAYTTPSLGPKHIQRFDTEIWVPARMQTGMRCLEIGCGTGLFTSWLAETGARIEAMDLSADLIDIARSRGMDPARVRCECKPGYTRDNSSAPGELAGCVLVISLSNALPVELLV